MNTHEYTHMNTHIQNEYKKLQGRAPRAASGESHGRPRRRRLKRAFETVTNSRPRQTEIALFPFVVFIEKPTAFFLFFFHTEVEDEEEWMGMLDWDTVAASTGQSSS